MEVNEVIALSKIREQAGLSQNELASKANVSQSAISDIEAGRTKAPRIDTLLAVAAALNCTLDDLFDAG